MSDTDWELLARYTRHGAEDAFAEIVRRHIDLVHSAALRQVRSPQLAEEVAQSAFFKLARNARQLAPGTVLIAWLYRITRRDAIDVVRREARRQLREQIATEMNAMNATAADWTHIEPLLDEAMHALDETDRAAVLLRYFENKSLREVGQTLGASENAAQKRLTRAVERLREFFARRGITAGASGLIVTLSANAVQAAPIGLCVTISAAAMAGTTAAITATSIAAQAIAMTAAQKTLIATAFVAAIGTGIYQTQQVSTLRSQIHTLQQEQGSYAEQIQQLTRGREDANARLAMQSSDSERLARTTAELLRLRSEMNALKGQGTPQRMADSQLLPAGLGATIGPSPENIALGRELGMAVVRGDPGAFEKLSDFAKAQRTSFNTNSVGLDDTMRGQLARETFAPIHAAFEVIAEAASNGNPLAFNAVVQSTRIPELKGQAIKSIGILAGRGDDAALETLLNPQKHGFVLSSVVSALKPSADNGNQKAIEALAAIAGDDSRQPLWYMAADGLSKAAESGNGVAIDALIGLSSASTNRSVLNAVVGGLQKAAANQNTKAVEALRVLGVQ